MCGTGEDAQCDGFLPKQRVNSPYEYWDLVRQILEIIQRQTLRVVSGTLPLEEIANSSVLLGDNICHVLECTTCSRRFKLDVETYHGSGGVWEPIVSDSPSSNVH